MMCVGGSALALTIITSVERIGLWQGFVASPHFTVTELSTTIRGLNRVDVKVTLRNADTNTHSANVTAQLLDANGDVVAEQWVLTADVAGNSDWSYVFTFREKDIAKSYDSVLVIVKQLT
jgi:hypothetical protein